MKATFPHRVSWKKTGAFLLLTDILALAILYELVHYARLSTWVNLISIPFLEVLAAVVITLYVMDVYRVETPATLSRLPVTAAFAALLSIIVSASLVYFHGPLHFESIFGRGVMPIALVFFAGWAAWSRYALSKWMENIKKSATWLFLGTVEKLNYLLSDFEISATELIVLLDDINNKEQLPADYQNCIKGDVSELSSCTNNAITGVIVATDKIFNENEVSSLMGYRASGASLHEFTAFYEQFQFKVPVLHLKHGWFMQGGGFDLLQNAIGLKLKRVMDALLAVIMLIVLSPVFILTAILILLDTRGPVFYSQIRLGLNDTEFKVHKFRSMVIDAEKDGAKWAEDNDPRITRIGNFIRTARIDELPQLWNVLKGEMSFIGPRPERPEFIQQLEKEIPYYDLRHLVMPGITGWAQVMYPYGASVEDAREKLQYDLYYIKNFSLLLDFVILMKTLRIVLRREGR
ncbi:MAG: sugar transferase [Gammaproteobacteria bacterium]|nr:sugar transferase [Gammaproteobacteria bacterium]